MNAEIFRHNLRTVPPAAEMLMLDPGPIAELRRMGPDGPGNAAYWRLASRCGFLDEKADAWMSIVKIMAILTSKGERRDGDKLHESRHGLGEALCPGCWNNRLPISKRWQGSARNSPMSFDLSQRNPGGPTMKGIIQREYDAWRRKQGKRPRPVRQIEDDELRAIYRGEYLDVMACDSLGLGLDLCAFDAAVNSGVGRAKKWLEQAQDIDASCNARLDAVRRGFRQSRALCAGMAKSQQAHTSKDSLNPIHLLRSAERRC
jgi:Glycosyl hydrolase 108